LATGEILRRAVSRYLLSAGIRSADDTDVSAWGNETVFETEVYPGGKPYLKDYPEICFNLSHSGDYVCCAVGDEPVGVDIQKHVPVKEGLAERFFTEDENRQLKELSGEESEQLFFRMWSIKESYIKFTGQGMKQGIDTFGIDWKLGAILDENAGKKKKESEERGPEILKEMLKPEERIQAYFEEYPFLPGYSLAVCRENLKTEVIWCNLEEIL
jgi:4'-phosphopantetheinyl transferase